MEGGGKSARFCPTEPGGNRQWRGIYQSTHPHQGYALTPCVVAGIGLWPVEGLADGIDGNEAKHYTLVVTEIGFSRSSHPIFAPAGPQPAGAFFFIDPILDFANVEQPARLWAVWTTSGPS